MKIILSDFFQMLTSVKPTMEDVTRHALTLLALLNVPVVQGSSWQRMIWIVKVIIYTGILFWSTCMCIIGECQINNGGCVQICIKSRL